MVLNITVDDTAGVLSYSSGWRVQPSADDSFFQGTYHASETSGQNVSVTFNGTAVYIYGSKGTTYGAFKVQLDNLVTFNTSALPAKSSPDVKYQQLLYSNSFTAGTHTVLLTTTDNAWVDIDYVVLTSDGPDEGNPDPGSFTSTVSALDPSGTASLTDSSSASSSSSSSTPSGSSLPSSSGNSSTSTVTIALTGVFGGLLFLVLAGLLTYRLLAKHRRRQYEREREFRRGPKPPASTPASPRGGEKRGVMSTLLGGGRGSREGTGASSSAGRNSSAGDRSGTPFSGMTGGTSSPFPVRPSHASGNSPYGAGAAYQMTRGIGGGGGGPGGGMHYYTPAGQASASTSDPRYSIDFLSVRS